MDLEAPYSCPTRVYGSRLRSTRLRGAAEGRIWSNDIATPHQQHKTSLQEHDDHPLSVTRQRVEINAEASRNTHITAPVRQRESCPFHVRPTMENGLGCPIFLPDNRLRLSRLKSTRGGQTRERTRSSNLYSPNFNASQTNTVTTFNSHNNN